METINIEYLVENAGKLHRKYVETYIEEHKKFKNDVYALNQNSITILAKQKIITETDTKYLSKLVDIVTSEQKPISISEELIQLQKTIKSEGGDVAKMIVAVAVDSFTETDGPVNGPIACADVSGALSGAGVGGGIAGTSGAIIGGIVGGAASSGAAILDEGGKE